MTSSIYGTVHGTPEHAEAVTDGRHPATHDALQWLTYSHLPPRLREFSAIFYSAAVALIQTITTDSPELTTALNGILAAKDSAVRAGIKHKTGRAGSVPRPQEIVAPPKLAEADTLEAVHAALIAAGLDHQARIDTIADMQNRGVFFRVS